MKESGKFTLLRLGGGGVDSITAPPAFAPAPPGDRPATTPRVSVAMSVHNDAAFLPEAIESILAQSFGDFEFVIVDDGSTDGSGAIIDDYARRDGRVQAIHQPNHGLIFSLNRAIATARGELIARMDGDDVALPERFARQVAFLDAHPDHGVVGTSFRNIDGAGRVSEAGGSYPLDHHGIVAALGRWSPIVHPSVMMRRDTVIAVGGYRAAYRHCEDFDLWLRLSQHTQLANLPDRLLHYRRSDGQVSVRHVVAQQTNAAIAMLAHRERLAGAADPTAAFDVLPAIERLDALFGRNGVARDLRAQLSRSLVWSRQAMAGPGFAIVAAHLRDGGDHAGLWRSVVRLARFGLPARAIRLAALLAVNRAR